MKKKLLAGIVMLAVGAMTITGCGGTGSDSGGSKVSIVGSTTIAEPIENLVSKYKENGGTLKIEVQGNGSSAGIKAAADGTADIGMASRELSSEEKGLNLKETVIAYDGIAVVVNPTNSVTDLSKEQIKGIFEGTIKNWSEVGGSDQNIVIVTREAGSGTRSAFEEIVGLLDENKGSTIANTALVSEGTGSIMATVASKEAAVGFISLGYMNDTVKSVSVDGVAPNVEDVRNGSYAISRPLLLVTAENAKAETGEVLDFVLSPDGQAVIGEKYIPVTE